MFSREDGIVFIPAPIQDATKGILKDPSEGGEVLAFSRVTKDGIEKLREFFVGELGMDEGYQNPVKERNEGG